MIVIELYSKLLSMVSATEEEEKEEGEEEDEDDEDIEELLERYGKKESVSGFCQSYFGQKGL